MSADQALRRHCGADRGWLAALGRDLGQLGARPRPLRLTRRELQVADLIARGCTNREIARVLVVSPRTAEAHVQHILTKLTFRRRAQVATWWALAARNT